MRILQVVPYFVPAYAYGGPPVSSYQLSVALGRRGHEVTVLTTDALDSSARQQVKHTKNGLEVYYLKNLSNYLAWNHRLFLPLGTNRFLQKRAKDFDIIHVHEFRTSQNIAVRRHALRTGTPYVLSAHGSVPRIVRKRFAKSVFDSIIGYRVLEDAAMLIALSNAEVRQYEEMGVADSKIAVIPNGIDPQEFSSMPTPGTFSRRHGLEGKKLIIYLGRINARKGLDTLLDSVRKLATVRRDLALVFVGPDDGYRGHLEKTIRRFPLDAPVVFAGLITMPEKLAAYVDSDVIVYPGSFEIFGLVPFEALLCRKPVVVADDSGCGEIIKKESAGIAVPPGDSEALASAIGVCLDDGIVVKRMVERGNRFVREQLSWGKIAENMESIYMQAATSNHSDSSKPGT
jgi:glycosyltransferase involved in cell wall biosynthesis